MALSLLWNQMHMVISFLYYSYVLCSHYTTSLHTALLWGAICQNMYEYHGVSYNIQKIIIPHYMGLKLGLKCCVAIFMNIINSEYFNIWHPILYIKLVGYMELPDQPPFDLSFWFFLISKCFFFILESENIKDVGLMQWAVVWMVRGAGWALVIGQSTGRSSQGPWIWSFQFCFTTSNVCFEYQYFQIIEPRSSARRQMCAYSCCASDKSNL